MNVSANNYTPPWNNSDVSHRPTLFLNDIYTDSGVIVGRDSVYDNWIFEGRPSDVSNPTYGPFVIFGFNLETNAAAAFTGN